ncbi:Muscle M-line assembly protein unc-89 [Caenorhabditis elegans]|uniref:Muscle M-line assembly protein unc-89 n=1 Tax=Caenorhabditis elegans TaxID=6239 RepID=A0A2C9C2W9_CAEEL|nr:Muscle M-line assembly protein unc-89 [Caenorhabditis elegans]SOF58706.1 Muscle M-line assembly protein unc-89 [Caenorhabditis elegans]|eukprot:NP_001343716.1 Muscle M-line assembly protein unc-89 [Caenorhabditis elegans]
MASRRQKQFDRKYSSYRKFTATEDVNYSTHSSRSSYRSESLTSRTDGRGRSTSSEIIAGSESRSYPVYIAIQDYTPDKEDVEAIPLEQGQIVEVLDKKNSVRWLVRTKARPPRSGWVPGSYFETPTEFYKQRRRTREIENVSLSDEQAALVKRDQVYHELLRSEEEFVSSLRTCVDDYIKVLDDPEVPEAVKKNREELTLNIPELYNFHANVMLKGLNYYSDDPGKVGQTFVRLEKDFESHVEFYKQYADTLKLLEEPEIKRFFEGLSAKNDAGASSFVDHVKEIADRMVQYQNYFKEFVKYSARAHGSSKSIQKALELVTTIPQRVHDLEFTNNLKQHPGDTGKLGRIIRHDAFQVWEGDEPPKLRYVFLFRNKIMFTEQDASTSPPSYTHYSSIRLDKYNIRQHTTDEDTIVLQPQEPGLPSFRIKPKDFETSEYVRKAWLRDIAEEQEKYAAERDAISMTATSEMTASSVDFDMNASDQQSEFSEWSGSRKSSLFPGPEEGGPPRKKVKSPPVISPTGSSTSIYSGGSSSIDWTTTGTTLEMQGTRVTRTQYGFRTLQESSAKMCLKVTGYPLPDITWYKDDVQLHEDERHTFYSDEDGFFAMTIDPVQVTDTGRYTCMATNEYGQASTSAFFRVLKVEKEAAPPAFVTKLRDKECKEGDVIDFECEVEGWPEPELVWLVDDQPLRPSHDFRLQYDGQTAKLEIRDAQPDDTGVYTVKIQNEFGSIESKAELFVQADPDKNHVAPEFQATIEYVECDEGEEVRFKSVITGDPNPEIIWFINGKPLSESEKVKFISEDGICILTIKDVTRHFDGMVTCQGSNRLGSASCDGRLKVRVPPAPPTFNKPLEDKTVQEKSTVVFEVDVSGWPEPTLTFTLCGKELKNGEEGVEIVGHDGFYRISIPNTSMDKHDGEIVAKAQNEHGTAESRARLTVEQEEEESRSAPTFLKDIEDQTVKTGEFAVFETTVRGNPNPEVTWFINGHKMDQGSPGVKIEAHNHDHKLTIDSAQYAGTVLCRAENAVGRFETKARLVVLAPEKQKKPPKFVEILVDKTETVDNTVVFEVRVEGEPKPTVTWYLKGEELKQSDRVEIREFDGSIKISIKNIKIEDAGEIRAVATNSEGSDETKAKLTVQKKPFAPEFDLRPVSLTVEKGSEAVFSAHAFGIPLPTYEWSVNGRKVRDGQEGARVTRDESTVDGASILTIDTATYYSEVNHLTISVVAENTLGAEETGAQLTIEPKKESVVVEKQDLSSSEVQKEIAQQVKEASPEATTTITMETSLTSTKTTTMSTTEVTSTVGGVTVETKESESESATTVIGGGSGGVTEGSISVSKIEVVSKTDSQTDVREGTPKRRVSFAEEELPKEVIDSDRKKKKSPSPDKKEKSPEKTEEKPASPTKKTGEEVKSPKEKSPASPTKKEKSPAAEEVKSPTKKEKSPSSPTKKEKSPSSPTKKTGDEVKEKSPPKSPTKKEKSPEKPEDVKSPVKKEKSPDATNIVEVSSETTIEKTETTMTTEMTHESEESRTSVKKEKTPEKVDEKPKSPTKKDKSPEKSITEEIKSPVKKEKSPEKVEEKPASPTKKEKSPEKPASPTKKSENEVKSPTKKEKSPEKSVVEELKSPKEKSPEKADDKPKSPTKKEKSPEKSATEDVKSPTKKEKSPEKVEEKPTSPTKKESSPTKKTDDEVKSPTKKEKSPQTVEEKPASPTKKEKSPEKSVVEEVKSPKEKSPEKAEEKPKSPTKKEKSPEKSAAEEVKSPTKKEKSPEKSAEEKPKSPTKKESSPVKMADDEVKSPTKKEKSPEKVEEKPASPTKKEKTPEKSAAEELKSPTKKEKSPSSPTKKTGDESKEKSPEKPEEKPKSPTPKKSPPGSPKKKKSKSPEAEKPPAPKLTRDLKLQTVNKTDLAHFEVVVEHATECKWFLDGKEITTAQGVTVSKDDQFEFRCSIDTTMFGSGTVSVVASNAAGSVETKTELKVLETPKETKKPEFTDKLRDMEVTKGDTVQMDVIALHSPLYKWYQNGNLLEDGKNGVTIKNEENKSSLIIPNAQDSGKITVEASNEVGSSESSAQLTVNPPSTTPIVVDGPKSVTIKETETAEFKATISGFPAPTVKWTINEKIVEESRTITTIKTEDVYTLKISNAKIEQTGTVKVTAQNSAGQDSKQADLKVEPNVKAPKFKSQLTDKVADEGEPLRWNLELDGPSPGTEVSWLLNGQPLTKSDTVQVVDHGDGTYHVTIAEAKPEMSGTLTAKAKNAAGECETSAKVTVNGGNKKPEFVQAPQNHETTLEESVKFSAIVTGKPMPNVTWYLNNKKLIQSEEVKVKYVHETGKTSIRIQKPLMEHNGTIRVEAENVSGKVQATAQLKVDKKTEVPKFTTNMDDRQVKEGEDVKFTANVEGYPEPSVAWTLNGEPVSKHPNITVTDKDGEHTIEISAVTPEQAGELSCEATNPVGSKKRDVQLAVKKKTITQESITVESVEGVERVTITSSELSHQGKYTCIAENTEGTSKTEAFLTVQGEAPVFTKELQNKELSIGEKLVLSCSVKGSPQPHVDFYSFSETTKVETKITSSSRIAIEHDQTNTHWRMVISQITKEDIVSYKAIATNSIGTATSTSKITTKVEAPVFEQGLKKTSVKEKEEIKMEVKVGGSAPDVEWFKDDKPVSEDGNHEMKKNPETGVFTLVVKQAATTDAGKYTAKASNPAGTAESSAEAEVTQSLEKPTFVRELVTTEVKINETATLSVTVKGVPDPSVEWLKDGQPVQTDSSHVIAKVEGSGSYSITIKDARLEDSGKYACRATNPAGEAKTEANFAVVKNLVPPEFVEKLSPLEVKEKESTTLSVKVVGTPEPSVEWFKDDTPISIDNVHVIQKQTAVGSFSLTINDARQGDVGIYSCRARNEAGEALTTANFGIIRDSIPPEFTQKLRPLEVREQETLDLKVTVIGTPVPNVEWFKDDKPINIDNSHIFAKDEGSGHHTLTIKQARGEDVGVYTCKATNEAGEAKTTANMAVQEEIEAPLFVQGLKPYEVEQGKPAELVVRVEGKPEPEVKWFKDGVPIAIDNQHVIEKKGENGSHTLVIKDTNNADFGKYTCQATNKAGKDETVGELKIPKYSFEKQTAEEVKPLFIEPLKETFAVEGDTVVLECKVNKESHPQIKFFKNDQPVEIGQHMQLEVLEDGNIKLTIQNAKKEDVGAYRCEAVNVAGKANTNADLKIQFAAKVEEHVTDESGQLEEIGQFETVGDTASSKTDTGRGAPEFVELLRSCTVTEKQQAILKCKVKGEPRPKIKWTKEGKEVEMSARVRAEHKDDGTLTLTFDNVTQADAGEYRCEAENEYGSAWTEGPIIVTLEGAPKIDGEAPDFLQPVKPAVVTVGETAVLEGKISGKPKPSVKWYKNGEELKPSDRVKIENLDDGTQRLTVTNAKLDDMDEYRCEASNEFGDVWSDVTLTVKEPAQVAPGFFKELSAIQVKETETAKFECKVSGTKPDVKWFKDGTPLKEDKRVHFESTDDGTQRLVIEDSKTDDQGNYRIEVSNDAGVANSKVPLTVVPSETLKIKKGLTDVNVTQGTKILLSVEVEGKPKTVKWYKGTETVTSSQTTKIVQVTESEYKLEIESAEMSDTGAYRVVLSTDSFSVESSATVTVTKAAEKISLPSFKKGLADQSVPKGTPLVLEVEIEGKPKDVKWYKNGDEIKDGKVEDLGNGKYRLTIPDFQEKDVGEYSVTAANEAGEIESKAKVNVSAKPEIVSGLVPTTVKQGETATFNVKVKGPVKGVKWYKNGKEIPDAKTKDNGDGSYSLEIPNAQVEDAADYKVVVSNDAGDADSSAALTVKLADDGKDKVKPEIVSGLIPTTVKQGETATFNVKVKGPVKQVKWYKNGKEIPNAKAKDNGDGSYSLEIPNAQLDDTADYKVVVSNDAGDADSSAALTVKLPGIAIVKGLEDAEVPKGKKAVLQVETNKKPKEIKWYKNGKEITPSDKAQPGSDGDNKPQLVIPDAGDDDAAEYKVVLTDEDGNTADSSCALTVKLPAKEPKIIKGLEDQVVSIGSPIKLEIETSGSPKTVKWYKNGKELPGAAAKTIKIQKIDDNKYVLEIPSSVVEDTGDYKVEVANEAGSANSSGKITVEPKITFLKPLKDQSITEGENAEFSVETNTKPRIVKWYKNGQEIKPNSRFIIEQKTDTKYQLVIKNAVRDDADTYKIVLENTAGEAESSAQLTVKKAKAGLCKIVKGLEDQVVAKGAKMVFEVKIQGEPEDVRWLRDANVISAGANAIIEKIDDTTYRLIIPSADLKDAGEYTVEVINESGKAKSDAKGEVDEKPEIVRGLENIEIPEGDDDVFKVEVSAPVRQVKWYKNDQEIKPNSHLEAKKIGPKKYELAINRAQLDDGADYKVVLSNAAGDCDSSAALTVVKPNVLKIVDGLKDVDVEEPQPVELKVKVEGIPKVIKWYKNGQELKPDADGFKFEEKPESGEFSLTIPSSKKSDGGAYRVVLGNDKGEVYSGSVVHVKSAKSSEPTSGANFLSPLKDTEVEEGDMLTLQCTIAGEPFPEVIWEKDGVVLQKDDRITMRVALDGTATLRIRSAKKSDIGQYRVTAKNEAGSATSDCKVTVTEQGEQPSKPKFVIPLKTGAALPGDKKEFNVKVRGLPKPTLQWFLNGIPIKFDDRITLDDMADGNYCLTIRDVREEDFGTLKCIAKNENGTDETVCEFQQGAGHDDGSRDDLRYPPRFNVPLWDRRIPVGDPMFIECHVDANPTAEVEWFKDGKKIEHTAHTEIRNTVDGACRIKIIPFEESDIGVYMCVAVNELGQAETQATYQVEILEHVEEEKRREYAPKINPPLEDKTVNGGQPIRLSCKVDAIPRASVVWYKDGLPLRADSRTSIQYEEDGTATLAINDSTEEDIGAYRCVATNAHGTINTSCSVNVKVPKQEVKKEGEEPFFTKGLVDLWADRGDSFTLKCAVTGDPFPEIKWYRNGQLLRNGPRTVIETSPDGSCSLTVNESTMSDEGIYRCEAENAHGKAKTQATAHVQMALGKTEKPKMDEGKPPKFILELSDMSVSLGNVIDLECKVTGLPNPSVKWSKDGGPLIEDSRFEWSNEASKGVYQLRIKNATVHDEGTYRCVATNENGSATTKSFVRMDDGLGSGVVTASQPPRFTLKMGDVRTTEGQPLKLECKVDASPLPEMVWYKDGAIVTPSDRIQISLSPDGVATLLIPSCVYDDDGIYRVIATNPSGTAQDKGTATVKKLPRDSGARRSADRDVFDANKAPKLMEPLENIRIPEKQSFRLRCKFSGDPKPTIKWFKDGERVFPYGRLQLIESPDGVCELVVDSATRQDAGGYRCVAENTYGSARTSCDVNVIRGDRKPRDIDSSIREGKAPGFTTPLTIRRAKPGDSVTFECLPFGNPFPSIKWLKDGLELFSDEKIKMEAAADGTQRLILSDVTFLSEGYFRCVATNEHGTASTKAELVIEGDRTIGSRPLPEVNGEPEECKPRIRRGLYNMSIHEGNVVEMIVCATGIPTPTVKWYKDGQEIVGDGPDGKRVIFTDERGIHHLVIVNASPDDEGEYSLEATNKLGSAKTEGSLNIIRPRHIADADERGGMPFPPGFVRQLKNKHVFNHMPTIFDCLVVGHPAPEVEWFHNGKKIVPGGRIKIQSCGGGSHALIILDTTLEDAGEYVATAKNSHGSASSSAVLDVTVPFLDSIKFNGEIDVTPYLTEEYGFKKLNTASLPTPPDRGPFIKEVTGHYLTLSWIPTKRAPPRYPQVTYVIEIRELPEKQWSLLEYNIPEPVCKVRNLELGKSYQFRVRAENIYGISDPSPASPPSRLMAPPQPVFDRRTNKVIPLLDPYAEKALDMRYSEQYACAPWFSPGVVEKRYCAENDTLTIVLNVSGFPDPDIKWKFRGWDIDTSSPTSKCKVYTYGGSETTLAITGFSKENVGQYQCFAKNDYGDAQQNIMVDLATRPNFIQPLVNKTFSSAQPMRMDVRVDGEPFPELKWMKEWRPIVESSRIKFVQDGPYLCSLIINDPMWRDSGIYSCVAVNDAGQATTSCTVTVEAEGDYNDVELPRRRVTIESRRVRELYEISEKDEKLAAEGAPFRVKEKATGREFLAQLRPIDDALMRHVDIHNSLDHPGIVQMHRVLRDEKLALVVFDNANSTIDGLSSLAHPGVEIAEPKGVNRETCVRVFVRQLLLALKHMHDLRIAHLDLRPETILLQDDKLKLADFGQARRLLRGLITGEIKGSPEFVSPEIVRSYPLTLATDMWSTGVLTYVLLTGLSPFHGDNDNETLANVDSCQFDSSPLGNFSYDAGDFVKKLLTEIPVSRLTVDEALDHPWINDEKLKTEPLSADTLREFKYQHKWLERRVFVQQTPSEQILEAILGPATAQAQQNAPVAPEGRRPAEIYDYLRIQPKKPPPTVEYVPQPRKEHPPFIDEFGQLIDGDAFDRPEGTGFEGPHRQPPQIPPQPQRPNQAAHDSRRHEQQPQHQGQPQRIPVDQYGRPLVDPRYLNDPSHRPSSLDDAPFYVDKYGNPVHFDKYGRPMAPQNLEKRKLIPQDKGETPSHSKKEKTQHPVATPILASPGGDQQQQKIPMRMIRGERREIEEEIANRILSDISEEGSIAGSLASLEDFEIPKDFQVEASEPSTPTLTPEVTIRETIPKPTPSPTSPQKSPVPQPQGLLIPAKVTYSDSILAGLPAADKKVLEDAENDPSIPVGAPLFLEGLHGSDLTIDTTSASGLIKVTSPAINLSPNPKSPRRSTPGTKSPVVLSPRQEHSMEVLIATKRGKPGFLPPGELAEDIDDEDAFMDDRKKQVKPKDHDGENDFKDEKERLEKDKNRRTVNLDDLDKYRPSAFYKDDSDFGHPGYDIDATPWDSHYQIGPDTYLMAARGAAFNSRVRNYREELFGMGAPTVKQGFLGVRNRDITVRERRRYTDILRETTQGLEPKSHEQSTALLQKAPSATAIERIKADIEKVTPCATKKNDDGTFAPIFTARLRDVYLRKNQPAIFECAVSASPAPKVTWDFQGKILESNDRVTIEQDNNVARLILNHAAPYDLGEYVCTAINEYGTDKSSCRLISGETPSRPGRPEAELSSDTEIFIQWEAPEGPTYLEGITYRLEYRVAGPNDHGDPWITVSEKIDDESVIVKHLSPLGIYQFRVTAQNGFGLGLPSLSSRIVQTHGKGAPKLQIDVLKSEIRLNVVSMPQKSTNQLGGISEESEEDSEARTANEDMKSNLQLQTDDPTGRFQIGGLKFKGRFSVIRDAVDSTTEGHAHCAVKIRHPSSEAISEYESLRDGQHENVQRLIAAFNNSNFLYLLSERLYEDVFSRFVFNDYYTEEQVALTMRQVTSALHFLHFKGIAHLDVNPHNIMFQSKRSWVVKLVDFGRAQKVSGAVKPVDFDTKWASPEFHIPETPVTVQSDMWGMGVVTFCLLAGFHPFTSEYDREEEIKENVINVKCDPNLIPVNASQECLSFATWALKKSPVRRMRTDEALSHKFLSSDPSMVRRRESIKYSASRLRKLAAMIRQPTFSQPISEELESKYGK